MSDLGVWGKETSPYHRGERALHERYGRYEEQTAMARHVHAPQLDDTQQRFIETLDYVVVGSVDATGRPWASMIFGEPGFVRAPDRNTIEINAEPLDGDRLRDNITPGAPMSIVAVELATRRRIRSNVTFTSSLQPGIRLHVDQAYGNCPKYIQSRTFVRTDEAQANPGGATTFTSLTPSARAIVERSDTFFVASHNPEDDQHDVGGVDVNHRGGRPGFVRIVGDDLIVPDYFGNFAFNTLGNFLINPVAGLLFVDFDTGDILQLTGTTTILWEDDEALDDMHGAQRGWRFTPTEGTLLPHAVRGTWEFGGYSAATLRTGTPANPTEA